MSNKPGWLDRLQEGNRLAESGNYDEGEKKVLDALKRAEKLDAEQRLRALQGTGLFYYKFKQFDPAIEMLERAEKLAQATATPFAVGVRPQLLAGIAMALKDRGDFIPAEHYYSQALDLAEKAKDKFWIGAYSLLVATMAFKRKAYKDAIKAYEYALNSGALDALETRRTQVILMFLYGERKQYEKRNTLRKTLIQQNIALLSSQLKKKPLPDKIPVPPDWGADPISDFVVHGDQNTFWAFGNKPLQKQLIDRHAHFVVMHESVKTFVAMNLNEKYPDVAVADLQPTDEDWLETYFFQQCHSSFLGAVRLAMTGQIPQAQMVLRGCLEASMYAYMVFRSPADKAVWLDRATDAEKVKEQFSVNRIWRTMEHHDKALKARLKPLYDRTIDEGAHPNVNAMKKNAFYKHADGQMVFSLSFLNPPEIENGLKEIIEGVDMALETFDLIFDSALL
ncbi:MAG TPA: tetratricopeptide repeat protein [Candidatus Obscuribacterales bacterium]